MTTRRICLFSFVITLGIWAWFSWPLPRYFTAGIPAAAHIEPAEVQPLIPGDHLQFMYYCWLAGDMVFGKTPLFCNPYEFNMGEEKSEAPRSHASLRAKGGGYRPDAYYFPFSLVYAVSALAGGRAFGWNLTGFVSLWLTFFLTWLLVRRYAKPDWPRQGPGQRDELADHSDLVAGCAALIAIVLPFRWINLFGGSPAGFACVWVPAVFLGIDLAAREGKPSGGILAGLALFFASWTDNHIFFFSALATPVWTLIAIGAGPNGEKKRRNSWQNVFAALLPIPLFLGGALAFPAVMQMFAGTAAANQYLTASVGARLWREIALYSPHADGFFKWFSSGVSSHIYIGFTAFVFLIVGGGCLVLDVFRRRNGSRRRLLVMILLLAGSAGIMALALGTNGPAHAILLRICRKIIPPYAMIRQPAKIFCLLPSFLAVATGLGLSAICIHLKTRPIKFLVALLFCAAITGEYVLRVHPTVSILDSKQGAYEAVAKDAASAGKVPHVLVVTLWPGDSHYSSIYQHYASLYRIRMVNGYNPFVSKFYFENVFRRYESVNQGWLTDEQIDELLRRKIEYVILHEDLFPEKVSPFPVGWTLKQFLTHARLQLIKQDGRVWAFKMLAEPKEDESFQFPISNDQMGKQKERQRPEAAGWKIFGCARQWQSEVYMKGRAFAPRPHAPAHDAYAVLDSPGAVVLTPPQRAPAIAPLNWMIRMRGEGAIIAQTIIDGKPSPADLVDITENEWVWFSIPVPNLGVFAPLNLKIAWESGSVDCDQILLSAGEWIPPAIGQTINLSAPGMFHAGYTSLADDTVVLEKEREAKALIFYGPKLPIEKGRYQMELVFSSDSPKGVLLGQFNVKRHDRDNILNWIPVMAGTRSLAEFTQPQNVPMYLEFRFLGNGNLKISGIKLTRLE